MDQTTLDLEKMRSSAVEACRLMKVLSNPDRLLLLCQLSQEEKRYVNQNIKILERSGLKLKPEARAQFKKLSTEIDDLSQKAD
jgi:Zn-dependent oligopeptidase